MSDNTKLSKSAQALGKIGGPARASKLSPERRREIALKANAARKVNQKYPKAVNEGVLTIGDIQLPCAVLEDGTRLITQTAMNQALGRAKQSIKKKSGKEQLPVFLDYNSLKPLITNDITAKGAPIKFKMKKSGMANGYRAEFLVDVCEIYLKARDLDLLPKNQFHIAAQCDTIMRALAKTGITALVDEASGYQYDRERDALQKLLKIYISEDLLPWTRRFPKLFFDELKRMYGCKDLKGTPQYFGHFINKYIYKQLAPGVHSEMKEINPKDELGNRKSRHHQWLSEDTGIEALDKQLIKTTTIMQVSKNKEHFDEMFSSCFPENFE